ncbi:hypothetical protein FE257_003314 [Aspergillus nanangensis]|uniref:Uncharacterized protein n=1 Tax=Aspergillus nanangensis TaxID=2582783 RepID=A0AAD4CSC2_ASPNN|nr:hypothetical protein FE257_003314 [Aspergillus nanangensis]
MVLKDSAPSSEYSSPPSPTSPLAKYYPLHLKPENIYPVDFITRTVCFFGKKNWNRRVEENVARRIENTRTILQRLPTQDELDSIVTHSSYSLMYERNGIWWGLFFYPLGFWYKTIQGERFKKYTNHMKNPELTWSLMRGPMIDFFKAEPAAARQVAFKATCRLGFWVIAGATISSTWGVYNETKETIKDPRMADFIAEMRKVEPGEMKNRKYEAAKEAADSRRRQIQQRHLGGEVEEQQQQQQYDESPVNPAAEAEATQTTVESGSVPSAPEHSRPAESWNAGRSTDHSGLGESQSQGKDFFEDDATPVAAEYKDTGVGGVKVQSQGSVWERLRRQNMSSSSQKDSDTFSQPQPQPPSNNTWGNPDADRQREREQAQADFNRMLEAERSKGSESFSESGWSKWN